MEDHTRGGLARTTEPVANSAAAITEEASPYAVATTDWRILYRYAHTDLTVPQ